jgi:hypothetical protein
MIRLKHEGNRLHLNGKVVQTIFPILDAIALPDSAIVLLDPDSYLSDSATFD